MNLSSTRWQVGERVFCSQRVASSCLSWSPNKNFNDLLNISGVNAVTHALIPTGAGKHKRNFAMRNRHEKILPRGVYKDETQVVRSAEEDHQTALSDLWRVPCAC